MLRCRSPGRYSRTPKNSTPSPVVRAGWSPNRFGSRRSTTVICWSTGPGIAVEHRQKGQAQMPLGQPPPIAHHHVHGPDPPPPPALGHQRIKSVCPIASPRRGPGHVTRVDLRGPGAGSPLDAPVTVARPGRTSSTTVSPSKACPLLSFGPHRNPAPGPPSGPSLAPSSSSAGAAAPANSGRRLSTAITIATRLRVSSRRACRQRRPRHLQPTLPRVPPAGRALAGHGPGQARHPAAPSRARVRGVRYLKKKKKNAGSAHRRGVWS